MGQFLYPVLKFALKLIPRSRNGPIFLYSVLESLYMAVGSAFPHYITTQNKHNNYWTWFPEISWFGCVWQNSHCLRSEAMSDLLATNNARYQPHPIIAFKRRDDVFPAFTKILMWCAFFETAESDKASDSNISEGQDKSYHYESNV